MRFEKDCQNCKHAAWSGPLRDMLCTKITRAKEGDGIPYIHGKADPYWSCLIIPLGCKFKCDYWKIRIEITSSEEHKKRLEEIEKLMDNDPSPDTADGKNLTLYAEAIRIYEEKL